MERLSKKPVLISDILSEFFVESKFTESDQWFLLKLWKNWSHLLPSESIKDSKPVAYRKGRLLLWVCNSVQLQEMNFFVEELKKNINLTFKKEWVKEIYFTVNDSIVKKKEKIIKQLAEYFTD